MHALLLEDARSPLGRNAAARVFDAEAQDGLRGGERRTVRHGDGGGADLLNRECDGAPMRVLARVGEKVEDHLLQMEARAFEEALLRRDDAEHHVWLIIEHMAHHRHRVVHELPKFKRVNGQLQVARAQLRHTRTPRPARQ